MSKKATDLKLFMKQILFSETSVSSVAKNSVVSPASKN